MTDRELLQHEFIDTTAKWGRDFVEVSNPLEENAILRFYHEPPQQPEPEPVAWVSSLNSAQPHCVTDLKYCTVLQHERGEHLKYIPVYTVPPQPEPEPVAWMWDVYSGAGYTSRGIDFYPTNIPFAKHTALYTAPPQREWVGLTDAEREEATGWSVEHIEAKLKEKNAC